jgi:hypothetical protein
MNTDELIATLSTQIGTEPQKHILRTPYYYSFFMVSIMFMYALVIQYFLGMRSDIIISIQKPLFMIECLLLLFLGLSSVIVAVLTMYPDMCNKKIFLKIPYLCFIGIIAFMVYQIFQTNNPMMIIPNVPRLDNEHTIECAVCIACIAIIPSGLMVLLQRKGASVYPVHSGSFAVLAASAVGAFVLRLTEPNDSAVHLMLWHYVPTFIFACIGAFVGRWVLRW